MRLLVRVVRYALLLMAMLVAALSPALAEPRLALVIANGAYEDGLPQLANPVPDGKLITATLEKTGFTVTLVSDVDQQEMTRAIAQFGDALGKAGPTTTGLFYYVGGGAQVDGHDYLVPLHTAILQEADFGINTISAETVLNQMAHAGISTGIVILDANRDNPFGRSIGRRTADAPPGFFIAYSTAPGGFARQSDGLNSPYAEALAAEMVKPGQMIEEVFRHVRNRVMEATSENQLPWESSSLTNAFYFVGADG
ncbi:MAG: caspase family protein [Rhodospirillaceae bacterium]|nr:caspase family protein [Rhodospirillaceae bacterium]